MTIATLPQATKVLELITQKKVSSNQLQRLLEGGFISDLLEVNGSLDRESFRQFLGLGNLMPSLLELTGVVLPEQSVTYGDRIAAGGYDWKDDDITEKQFPLTLPAGPRPLVLAHFDKVRARQQVEEWSTENGYEFALFDDLLAVGSHPEYKELQRQFPIIQLGSSAVIHGYRRVPYLGRGVAERDLDLLWYDVLDWVRGCRFLLVRKVQPLVT